MPGTPDPTDSNSNGIPDNLEGQCAVNGNDPNTQCPCDTENTITIGSQPYNQCQLLCSLDQSAQGNALRSLAHQLIAAELNVLNGASDAGTVSASCAGLPPNPYDGNTVANLIAEGNSLIATGCSTAFFGSTCYSCGTCGNCCCVLNNFLAGCVFPGGQGNTLGPRMLAVEQLLDLYNNGCGGVPHCA